MDPWWTNRTVYQIYPKSFMDSNGNGIGDLGGIIAKLDYLQELGVGVLWLCPIYASPNRDNGYDIANYRAIHKDYGTMEDMEHLIAEAAKRDIRIIMDLVINHTSTKHEWFRKSRQRIKPYKDYYFWRDGDKKNKPNNWTSFFTGSSWAYDHLRGQYYLHLFTPDQPDLNFRNPKVLEEIKEIMHFWLKKGVAGFRCDVINLIYKTSLKNGKPNPFLIGREHYMSQEGSHAILKELRETVLDQYDSFTVGETIVVTPKEARDYSLPERKELDMVFPFDHMEADQFFVKWFKRKFSPRRFGKAITEWQTQVPWVANYLENHDQLRCVSRFGDDKQFWSPSAKMLATLLFTLRGTPYIYQGQEIGMTNFDFRSMREIRDVESHYVYRFLKRWHFSHRRRWKMIQRSSRDNCRTPFQWNAQTHAGFSDHPPWINVNHNYRSINAEAQHDDPHSVWNYYRRMIALRNNSDLLLHGIFKPLKISNRLFAYQRKLNETVWTIILNFSSRNLNVPWQGKTVDGNYDRNEFDGHLNPYEAVILK